MVMVLDCFEHSFVINANHAKERFANVSAQLESVGITFERFHAIQPSETSDKVRLGELGCSLSHISVVELAKARGYANVLIFEDDAIFKPNFAEEWKSILPEVKKLDYDLLYLYDWGAHRDENSPTILEKRSTMCTHAYAVSSKYYDHFIRLISGTSRKFSIDSVLWASKANKWCISPSLVGQADCKSTINGVRYKARFDGIYTEPT